MREPDQPARGDRAPVVSLARLFWEFFKISLFVVGGGYAIAAVADEVFGHRLKWLREGEILDHMPIISTVPGLVAGNTAIYTGLRVAGRLGAFAALVAVAIPSCAIFTLVTLGFAHVPQGNVWLDGAFTGLRASLTGVVAGTLWRAWRRAPIDWAAGEALALAPVTRRTRWAVGLMLAAVLAYALVGHTAATLVFLLFGCVCIGGGFPLVPFYYRVFVGPDAWLVGMAPQDFSNLMAFTQMTPGPVSVNAATYFGYQLSGPVGGLVATAALLAPSYFLMTAVLTGLPRWRTNRAVRAVTALLKPVSLVLMGVACWRFAEISVWTLPPTGGFIFHPFACALALFTAVALVRRWMSIMALIFTCAALAAAAHVCGA